MCHRFTESKEFTGHNSSVFADHAVERTAWCRAQHIPLSEGLNNIPWHTKKSLSTGHPLSLIPLTYVTGTSHTASGIWQKPHSPEWRGSMGLDDIMPANLMSQPYPEGDHYPGLAAKWLAQERGGSLSWPFCSEWILTRSIKSHGISLCLSFSLSFYLSFLFSFSRSLCTSPLSHSTQALQQNWITHPPKV